MLNNGLGAMVNSHGTFLWQHFHLPVTESMESPRMKQPRYPCVMGEHSNLCLPPEGQGWFLLKESIQKLCEVVSHHQSVDIALPLSAAKCIRVT